VELRYEAREGGLAESVFVLAPGAKPEHIRLRYNTPVQLQGDGSLRLGPFAGKGYFTLTAPQAWQEVEGRKVSVPVAFRVEEEGTVSFRLGEYNRKYPLVIDPSYQWHTFYGSNGWDRGTGIALDASGNVYVTGYSATTWNGPSGESPLHAHSGGEDIVVLKLSSSGAYQWHTFYGSGDRDEGLGIALDASGDVYVAGRSDGSWNGSSGQSPLHAHSGSYDLVVLKLSSSGEYQWHTFYGSDDWDEGDAIALDASGNVYVTGESQASWKGPSGEGPFHAHTGGADIVVLKLSSSGAYEWHTFYGSKKYDEGHGIAVDASGGVYVVGSSERRWNGPRWQSPLHAHSGWGDVVILKLSSSGAYQWHTFYGSRDLDEGNGIAVDASGGVYVVGTSRRRWNGPRWQSPLHAHSGKDDIFVLKLSSSGAYRWHAFYGSESWHDEGYGVAMDASGSVYVAGQSIGPWAGPSWANPSHAFRGDFDFVVLKLSSSGAYQWHAFFGSRDRDLVYGSNSIALDSSGNFYVAGSSRENWGNPLNAHAGKNDILVLKLADGLAAPAPPSR
jgi:hypothetical protein